MRRVNRKRPIDYILPFLIFLGIGVICILGFQLWQSFEKQGKADVYFYVASGKAKILAYGEATWSNAFSGTKMLVGDALKTTGIGKSVLVFFNGTMIRMGSDTAVTLTDLNKESTKEKIVMTMDNGVLWVNARRSPGVKEANYEVRTSHLLAKAIGTVFEVESGAVETVRVMEGEVAVDVLINTNGKERVADTINVGVGQELVLDAAALKSFEENQSPSVLMALDDQFKSSEWYSWNIREDKDPTSYDTYLGDSTQQGDLTQQGDVVNVTQQTSQIVQTGEVSQQVLGGTQEYVVGVSSDAPVITKPLESARTVETGALIAIGGTVPEGTKKVIVERVVDGKTDSYTLGKFKEGDSSFSYNVSENLGNMIKGDNTYSFYAVNSAGDKSEAAQITIVYNKPEVTITDALVAPAVLTFNGAASSTVTTDTVVVAGSVKGAEKVVVNDYALSKFSAGATSWSYTAKESIGNLKAGANEYEVYSVDPSGKKSDVVKFTITYNKPAVSGATQQATQQGTQETSAPVVNQPVATPPVVTQQTSSGPAYGF